VESAARVKVAILAGGLGTRLGELTRDIPKPMIEIGGHPFLEYVVDSFAFCGLTEFVFLTGHRAGAIEEHFGDGSPFGVRIEYSRETELQGTGGAVWEARPFLGERFILTYGDVLRRFDYDRFVMRHPNNCLAVYPRRSEGNTAVTGGLVAHFDKNAADLPYVDAGFSVLRAEVIDLLPEGRSSFEQTVYRALAERGQLEAEVVNYDFYDIGTPAELARTRAALEGRRR
jgi:D-glycero-D-manno-heptose 1,7-bisphosphate phosphatase